MAGVDRFPGIGDAPMVHVPFEVLPVDLNGPSLITVRHHEWIDSMKVVICGCGGLYLSPRAGRGARRRNDMIRISESPY
jgi:hypothetical protein